MDTASQFEIEQEARRLQSAITTFFDHFSVGTFLNQLSWKPLHAGLGDWS